MIKIFHLERDGTYTHIANMAVPDDSANMSINDLLEAAYVSTQNFMGSWSIPDNECENGYNPDWNPLIEVVKPHFIDHEGVKWGHRSTSVEDIMEYNGKKYEVAPFGFKEI